MSGSACGPSCGWCGACTSAWERPMPTRTQCLMCGRQFEYDNDGPEPDYCSSCVVDAEMEEEDTASAW